MSGDNTEELRVTVSHNSDWIDETKENQIILENFVQYKGDSLSVAHKDSGGTIVTPNPNFVTPNENLQMSNPRVHPLFGRDRVFDHPISLHVDIQYHGLAHVHVVDPTGYAEDHPQWDCKSNAATVYSAFTLGPMHYHYHVIEIFNGAPPLGDAHKYYTTGDIKDYLWLAEDFRKKANK